MSVYALFVYYCILVVAAGFTLMGWRWALDRYADWLRERKVAAIIERGKIRARNRETAKTLAYIRETDPDAFKRAGTFDALVADVTASDYAGDLDHWSDYFAGRSETPTFDRLCADVARREAAELDVEWEREAGA